MLSIADLHVVVLGGTSRFGFATAKAALAEGARVTIASRSAEKLRGALGRLGNAASGQCIDVTNKPALERFFADLGPFDHLAVTVGDPLPCAGAVDTELWHRVPEAERLATFQRIGARLPVGRVGKPEDIAEAYLYVMKTGFSTGETIVVDSGALQAP